MSHCLLSCSRRRRQAGVTLIELMVAMLIGLLVLGAALGIFLSNSRAFSATQGLGRIQENSQAAFELMARDIREAGGNPCDVELPAGNITGGASWFQDWDRPLFGYESSGLTGQAAGTDAIQILRLDSGARTLTADIASASDTSVSYTPAKPGFEAGDTLMICDMRVLGIFTASADSGGSGTVGSVGFGSGNACTYFPQPNAAVCAGESTAYLFPKFSTLSRLQGVRWYVCNDDSLCRQVDGGNPEEVIQGVQDMQIEYLTAAGYVNASALGSVAQWNEVRAVRIGLTLEETKPGSGSTDAMPLTRSFDHVVALRNRTL